jgi:TatD DNase family protein
MLYDSHAHLCSEEFDSDRDEVASGLPGRGVGRVMEVACDTDMLPQALAFAEKYAFIRLAVGIHPHIALKFQPETHLPLFRDLLVSLPKVLVLGEIGLDYHYDYSPRDVQRECFLSQLRLARELNKPVSIHIREAHGDAEAIFRELYKRGEMPRGVMHCYSGSVETMKSYLSFGLNISLAGPVTFKNANKLIDVAREVPEDRLMIETDCPYLAPVPFRGRRNDPGYVGEVAEKIAQIRGIPRERVEEMTYRNAAALFGD